MKRRKWQVFLAIWALLGAGCDRGPFSSGDRVLVSKCMYDTNVSPPHRFDVVVFKYPVRPIEKGVPKNFIKRLLGLPGEILAILFGRIFIMSPEEGEAFFPEPKELTTKDGSKYQGLVHQEDDKTVLFEARNFSADFADWPGDGSARIKLFPRDAIASLEPIPVTERWKHRAHGSPDETDFNNDMDFMYVNHDRMKEWFRAGRFQILRKPPDVMLAMRRIVFDNDYQPKDLTEARFRRWAPHDDVWKSEGTDFKTEGKADTGPSWLRYRHLVVKGDGPRATPATPTPKPELITDLFGYNSVLKTDGRRLPYANWAGDLMLECSLEVTEPKGEFWMELSRGIDRFRARFDLATGRCTLFRLTTKIEDKKDDPDEKDEDKKDVAKKDDGKDEAKKLEEMVELAARDTRVKAKGAYNIKFANFGARLTVWVDRDLPFDQGHDYDPPESPRPGEFKGRTDLQIGEALSQRRGPTDNDLEPASLGVTGAALAVKHLRLWHDTYYTRGADEETAKQESILGKEGLDTVKHRRWRNLRLLEPYFYYVQPGHFMCLGDNSTASSDSRDWGLVPDRLMLGRAHAVYFPFSRAGPIK
jgi:hypothetical protein